MSHLGIEFTEIGPDYLCARVPVDERTKQPYGLLHGGVSVVLAETLGSMAAVLACPQATAQWGWTSVPTTCARSPSGWVTGTARPFCGRTTQVLADRYVQRGGPAHLCVAHHHGRAGTAVGYQHVCGSNRPLGRTRQAQAASKTKHLRAGARQVLVRGGRRQR